MNRSPVAQGYWPAASCKKLGMSHQQLNPRVALLELEPWGDTTECPKSRSFWKLHLLTAHSMNNSGQDWWSDLGRTLRLERRKTFRCSLVREAGTAGVLGDLTALPHELPSAGPRSCPQIPAPVETQLHPQAPHTPAMLSAGLPPWHPCSRLTREGLLHSFLS